MGRFITPDWIVQDPKDPQSLNRYAYCRNNPIRFTDPTGNFFFIPFIVAAAAWAVAHAGEIALVATIISLVSSLIASTLKQDSGSAKFFNRLSMISGTVAAVAGGIDLANNFVQIAKAGLTKAGIQSGSELATKGTTETAKKASLKTGENLSNAIGKSGLGAAEKSANITTNGITSGLADAKLGFNTMEAIGKVGGAAVGGTAAGILSHGDITSILSGAVSGAQIGNFVANPDIKLGFLIKEQGFNEGGAFYKGEAGWEAKMFGKTIVSKVTSGQLTIDNKNNISLITTGKSGNYSGDAARISYKKLAKNNNL